LTRLPEGTQPQLSPEELIACEEIVRKDPRVQQLARDVGMFHIFIVSALFTGPFLRHRAGSDPCRRLVYRIRRPVPHLAARSAGIVICTIVASRQSVCAPHGALLCLYVHYYRTDSTVTRTLFPSLTATLGRSSISTSPRSGAAGVTALRPFCLSLPRSLGHSTMT
jgi:hypothetical protein